MAIFESFKYIILVIYRPVNSILVTWVILKLCTLFAVKVQGRCISVNTKNVGAYSCNFKLDFVNFLCTAILYYFANQVNFMDVKWQFKRTLESLKLLMIRHKVSIR